MHEIFFFFFSWSKTHILHQNNLDINFRAPQKAVKYSNNYVIQFQSWLSMVRLSWEGEN